ncbi:MAG: cysteine desulfurase [Euryarchaeota archaeon]|nr:cysteine desulfurase [Euryarchaeota archaeon]
MLPESLREDFPALRRLRNGRPPVYLDSACMSLKPEQVISAMLEYYRSFPACSGYGRSAHWFAEEVSDATQHARERVAAFIGASPEEVVWTKNATEAINLVAKSLRLRRGEVVLTSDREHNSNLIPWLELEKRGVRHEVVPSRQDETFDLDALQELLTPEVKLVSVVHVSNLDGYALPVREIAELAHDNGSLVLVDAAQSVPHRRVDVEELGADFLAFSVHKMLGPSLGVLYIREGLEGELEPFIVGGDTVADSWYDSAVYLPSPRRFEAGLQDYAAQIGAAAAADYLERLGMREVERHERRLTEHVLRMLGELEGVRFVGVADPELASGIVSFRLEAEGRSLVAPSDVAEMLDARYNIMLRAGDHCVHSWFNARGIGASGSVRASFYVYNTLRECELLVEGVEKVLEVERGG